MKINLISGFLGGGKTTAIQKSCAILVRSKARVGVITNDQGEALVDTEYIRSFGIPVREVAAGCFCCNYDQLAEQLSFLRASEHPDIIFAETVGSCTDLIATVAKPLERVDPESTIVISVFADALFLYNLITGNASFLNDEVRYIFKNQLSEADILVINKIDLMTDGQLEAVNVVINEEFSDKIVLYQNSLDETSIQKYLDCVFAFQPKEQRPSLNINYDVYAHGEAMMGWVDQSLDVVNPEGCAYQAAQTLAQAIESEIRTNGFMIGHLKFLIDDGKNKKKISYTAFHPETQASDEPPLSNVPHLSLLINARVQALPSEIEDILTRMKEKTENTTNSKITVVRHAAFQPGYPRPTHRMVD